jgi:hypothetical protein
VIDSSGNDTDLALDEALFNLLKLATLLINLSLEVSELRLIIRDEGFNLHLHKS